MKKAKGILRQSSLATTSDNPQTSEEPQETHSEIKDILTLFNTALSASSTQQILLFTGIIHECDKFITLLHSTPNSQSTTSEFYNIYGDSLYHLASLSDLSPQEELEYLDTAISQYELGLFKHSPDYPPLHQSMAFALFKKASLISCPNDSHSVAILATTHHSLAKISSPCIHLQLASLIQLYANSRQSIEHRTHWNNYAIDILNSISPCADSYSGHANALLSIANYYAEDATDEIPCSNVDAATDLLQQAQSLLEKALALDSSHCLSLSLLGEIYIYLGNINFHDEEKEAMYYNKAVLTFKKCNSIDSGYLPEEFLDFIQELEA